MAKQADSDASKPWMIRDVPEYVRREVKAYAAQHGLTVAEALTTLIAVGLEKVGNSKVVPPIDLSNAAEIDRLIGLLEDLKTNPARFAHKDEAE